MTSETQSQTTNSSTPLLEGVQILIDRMESTPEDFVRAPGTYNIGLDYPTPKFAHLASALEAIIQGQEDGHNRFAHLTAEEKTSLLVAYRKMMRQAFTASVIAQLFEPKEEPESKAKQVKISTRGGTISGGFGSAVAKAEGSRVEYYTSNGQQMTDREYINKQIEAQIREHARVEAKRSEVPPWKL